MFWNRHEYNVFCMILGGGSNSVGLVTPKLLHVIFSTFYNAYYVKFHIDLPIQTYLIKNYVRVFQETN